MSVEEEICSGAESVQFPVGGDRAGLGWLVAGLGTPVLPRVQFLVSELGVPPESASGLILADSCQVQGSAIRGSSPHHTGTSFPLLADNKPAHEQPVCLVICLMGKRAERDGSGGFWAEGGRGTACGVMVAERTRSGWTDEALEIGRVSS